MRLDIYQAETVLIATEQTSILDEARVAILAGRLLSRLEQNGLLHAIQILTENAIGKAKHLLKAGGEPVQISAYDVFEALATKGAVSVTDLQLWNSIIGLRNRIVHDYMNIDMDQIMALVKAEKYRFVSRFLLEEIKLKPLATDYTD